MEVDEEAETVLANEDAERERPAEWDDRQNASNKCQLLELVYEERAAMDVKSYLHEQATLVHLAASS